MKKVVLLIALCVALFLPSLARAATFDYTKQWMTITTPHFFVRYAEENENVARKAAVILEEAYRDLQPKFNWKPWGRTEVVLSDASDLSNGLASVLPYNWILLYAAPPLPDRSLGHYDNWLRFLIYHELTHILHLDAARGWWKLFRFATGKTASPAGLVPTWVKEGEATYIESEYTKAGRTKSSFTEMMIRASVLGDDFPTIAQGDGLQWTWPGYHIPYLFGGEFIEYLVDTYGFDKLQAFNDRTQRTFFLSMVNYAARTAYGKTFVQLWKEWEDSLKEKYVAQAEEVEKKGVTPTKTVVPIDYKWEEYVAAPTVSPNGLNIAYSISSPHQAGQIRMIDLETGRVQKVRKKQSANQISWHPDSNAIVYSSLGTWKRFNRYFDLYRYDFDTDKLSRLTSGERARDPDFSPDGKKIVYVAASPDATDELRIYDVEKKESHSITPGARQDSRYANPRFSPDGKWIAVTAWNPGEMWKIYRFTADGRRRKRLTKAGKGMELRPWWTPDGNYVLYSSDETGIPNIYRVHVKSGMYEQITNVLSGAFMPSTNDGRTIAIQYYTSKGFELHSFVAPPPGSVTRTPFPGYQLHYGKKKGAGKGSGKGSAKAVSSSYESGDDPTDLYLEPKKYSPFGKSLFLPRFIVPGLVYQEDEFLFSIMTGGADVLRWHNWMAGATYMTGANYAGYFARYFYNRWLPVMGFGVNDYVVNYGQRTFILAAPFTVDTRQYWEKRTSLFAFITVPYKNHAFSLLYSFENRQPQSALLDWERQALTLGHFGGFTAVYAYGDAHKYPAAVSREGGRRIKAKITVTPKIFGSSTNNEQIIFVGDWREYIRLWRHHVLAIRLIGGMTWWDELAQGTFVVGGALGEGNLARQSSLSYFPLRGLPTSAFGATRAMVLQTEYRFPIVDVQRGFGTWPLYVQRIHGKIFTDFGDGWYADMKPNDPRDFFDNFMLSVGAEITGDFVIGHGLPLRGRIGYGIVVLNRDRIAGLVDPVLKNAAKYGVLILEFGTMF